jgi:hypothetical protein
VTKFILDQDAWISQFREKPIKGFSELHTNSDLRVVIFHNPVNRTSMRLTKKGYNLLKIHLCCTDFVIDISSAIMPRDLLLLERRMLYPYFIQNLRRLIVFDESTACMLYLHHGNLQKYLDDLNTHL